MVVPAQRRCKWNFCQLLLVEYANVSYHEYFVGFNIICVLHAEMNRFQFRREFSRRVSFASFFHVRCPGTCDSREVAGVFPRG